MAAPTPTPVELTPLKRALLALEKMQAKLDVLENEKREPIAVLGMGCRFPGGVDSPESFWRLLLEGRDAVGVYPMDRPGAAAWQEIAPDEATGRLIRHGGFLSDVDLFDPGFFGISPREASRMDPQQRLLLQVSVEALGSAGLPLEKIAGTKAGVFVGIHSQSSDYYLLQTAQPGEMDTYTSTGCAHSIVANRLSYALDLHGPSVAVDTACSSSLVALHLACQSLRTREADLAFAGGVNLILAPESSLAFSKLEFLSVDGRCQTFDASANGFVRAEGCGVIVLKRLADAVRDGDPILAVVRGSALNQDGATNGLTAPNGFSQQAVIQAALENARVKPAQISYIETHGTGTPLGDPIEVDALRNIFGPGVPRVLGSVKTNIGHTEAAAGIAGVIKCVLSLLHHTIPSNLHFRALNPHIDLTGSDFILPTKPFHWESPNGPRFAGVSSFGFGGTNGHVILEEAPSAPTAISAPEEGAPTTAVLLPLSARSEESLKALVGRWREFLGAADPLPPLADVIYTASVRRSHYSHRLAIVAASLGDLRTRLAEVEAGNITAGVAPHRLRREGDRLAWVFSGQGPQWWAMGRELLESEPVYRQEFECVDLLIQKHAGFSIREELAKPEAQSQLHRTDIAQPALFALQISLAALWKSWGIEPGAVVGHSVGEVAAACAAGILSLEDAVIVVCHRGRLMHRPSGRGRMAAVEMSVDAARQLIVPFGNRVVLAAINTPESVTLSGEEAAINEIAGGLEKRGVSVRLLKVDYAFHSPGMDAVKPELRIALRAVKPADPALLMISTVTGAPMVAGEGGPDYWPENIRQPVLFARAIELLIKEGFTTFLEISPHPVLSSAVSHRLEALKVEGTVVASLRRGRPERSTLLESLGTLYTAGQSVAWEKVGGQRRKVVSLPSYPWHQKSYWLAANGVARAGGNLKKNRGVPPRWYYEVAWPECARPDAPQSPGASRYFAAPSLLADALAATAEKLAVASNVKTNPVHLAEIEELSSRYIAAALVELGFEFSAGLKFTEGQLQARLRILPRHSRLFTRMLGILAEEKLLVFQDDCWEVVSVPGPSWTARPDAAITPGQSGLELGLLVRCGNQLAKVLRGEVDPLHLLFPAEGSVSAECLYRDSPAAVFYNQLVANLIGVSAHGVPRGTTLRVLEIGAGTGGTTRRVLEELAGVRCHYTFTDVARSLVNEARAKYGARPDVRCAVLDIERPTEAQGFVSGGFDVILAANVLHATADLRATLSQVRGLLAPGGLLVLLETTARRRWIDLTFGLTEGWWRFSDLQLRPAHALLDPGQWCTLLADSGFLAPQALATDRSGEMLQAQAVLVARAPAQMNSIPVDAAPISATGRWLVFADEAGLILPTVAHLEQNGGSCVVVRPDKIFERSAGRLAVIRADAADDYRRLLDDGGSWRGVVHAWSLDATIDDKAISPDFQRTELLGCQSVLHIVQALVATQPKQPAKIWLLTRGAQTVWPQVELNAIGQAPLWGLGRTLAVEHPEMWGGLIDLDPEAGGESLSRRLASELCAPDGEDQIALGEESRAVARLVAAQPPSSAQMTVRADATYMITGGLGGLGPQIAGWLIEKGARHLLLVSRRPLPDRTVWSSLPREHEAFGRVRAVMDLERRGALIAVEPVDVADQSQMEGLFQRLRRQSPALGGIIHAAADIKFCALRDLTTEALRATLRPKVDGTWLLHALSLGLPLDFFVMFSSATTLFGASRIGHYAASNQALDFLAHCRRAAGLPALSVDWGAWEEIRLLGENRDEVERFGLRAMPAETALQAMSHLAADGIAQRMVADVDWSVLKAAFETRGRHRFFEKIESSSAVGPSVDVIESSSADWKVKLVQIAPDDRPAVLSDLIAGEVRRVLGMESDEPLAFESGLFEMGMDSLMSVQLKNRLAKAVDHPLPATLTFTYPTVNALAGYFLREVLRLTAPDVPTVAAVSRSREERAERPADDLKQLSDAEVKNLLSEELDSLSSDLRE